MNNRFSEEEIISVNGKTVVIAVKVAQDGSLFVHREGRKKLWTRQEAEVLNRLLTKALESNQFVKSASDGE